MMGNSNNGQFLLTRLQFQGQGKIIQGQQILGLQ